MSESTLLPIDAALEVVLEHAAPLTSDEVQIAAAAGRYLAEPVVATLDLPPFDNSAMDGFALRAEDTPGDFAIVGESAAGAPFAWQVGHGEAVTISTGAAMPAGADAVVPIEQAWVRDPGRMVEIGERVRQGFAVRTAGSDVRHGTEVLAAGLRLGPPQLGAAASLGCGSLRCGRRPRVAVLTTGTELRAAGEQLGPGQIYDSNGPLLQAALASAGAEVTLIPAAADTREAQRTAIEQALDHDVVLTTGGVSVGGHDLVREIERDLGVQELFWRVALKPGKPLSFGVRAGSPETDDQTLFFGIPGNPVSVLVCFELFVRPALAALQGARDPRPPFRRAALAAPVERSRDRDEMIRVRHTADGRVEPLQGQQSHQLVLTAAADGLARIPAGSGGLHAGAEIDYLSLGAS